MPWSSGVKLSDGHGGSPLRILSEKCRPAVLVLVVAVGLYGVPAGPAYADSGQPLNYVGSELCLSCHPKQAGWRSSLHATGLKTVDDDRFSLRPKDGVVADVDGNGVDDFKQGLDFNEISSLFDPYKPNAPVLQYDRETGYAIRIGEVNFPVRFAYGGSGVYRQQYAVKIPVADRAGGLSAGHYISPVQYNEATNEYVPFGPEYWYDADHLPRLATVVTTREMPEEASFEKKCAGCHFTGITVARDNNGEWVATAPPTVQYLENDPHYIDLDGDGLKEQVNVGCERCHGPGSRHVLASGDPDEIINPKRDLTPKQGNEICASCHSTGKSLPEGLHDYPYDEIAGESPATNLGAEL